jgi:ParB/RepB/Spo0J family partition protein
MMAPKATDRIKAMQQQRAEALKPQSSPEEAPSPHTSLESLQAHFGGALGSIIYNRQIQSIPIGYIAPDNRPEMVQPRLLPPPDELMVDGSPVPEYQQLVAELLSLGQSLKERQIQPIVVYQGTNSIYPAARYLLLIGQRRWTAAYLVGLDAIEAVVVDPPTPDERVRLQYSENEDREEFSDMERAWSLLQMKRALGDAPWEEVEARLRIGRTRRHQIMRLVAFTPLQQREIARLRLQETQIRTLHTAVRNQELSSTQVDAILARLSEIAASRMPSSDLDEPEDGSSGGSSVRKSGIDGPTVARLVARARRAATTEATPHPSPRWLFPLRSQILQLDISLQRSMERAETLGPDDAAWLRTDIEWMVGHLERFYDRLSAVVASAGPVAEVLPEEEADDEDAGEGE